VFSEDFTDLFMHIFRVNIDNPKLKIHSKYNIKHQGETDATFSTGHKGIK